jgi:hypothetical protein
MEWKYQHTGEVDHHSLLWARVEVEVAVEVAE